MAKPHTYTQVSSLLTEQNKLVFKRDLNDDSDRAHLTLFGRVLDRRIRKELSEEKFHCCGQDNMLTKKYRKDCVSLQMKKLGIRQVFPVS